MSSAGFSQTVPSTTTEGSGPQADTSYFDDQVPASEFSLGIGYAHVGIGDSDSVLDSEDALRFDPAVTFSPFAKLPQVRLGAAVGLTMVLDNSERTIVSNGGVVIVGHSSVPLWLVEPEVRLAWRQTFGEDGQFYVEPGVGVGAVFAQLDVSGNDTSSGQSIDESDTTFAARAFLNVGARVTGGLAGLQVSYLRGGSLDLAENASGDVDEFYIGIFGSLRF
jgi:hypothetical protein